MKYVPTEIRPGERFVGNAHTKAAFPPTGLESLTTLRRGGQALDIDEKRLPPEHYCPVFVGEAEAGEYDRLRTAAFGKIRGT